MKGVAYIRVSTVEQDEDNQRKEIERFVIKEGIEILEWYVDKGQSGSKPFDQRPSARKLLEDIEKIKPDVLVAWALDRIGRNMLDTVNTILRLESIDVKVVTVKEEWLRTMDPMVRKLILSILAWVAEYERRRIRERQIAAWESGKQKGRPFKVSDQVIKRYLSRYSGLSKRAIVKIMRSDGYELSYWQFVKRVKRLQRNGK